MFVKNIKSLISAAAVLVFAIVGFGGLQTFAQRGQASLTLTNSDARICYVQKNAWSLTKTTDVEEVSAETLVTWTITATKNPDGEAPIMFFVCGGLTITNTGSAPATIGNIVVNLQRPNNTKVNGKNVPWVSVAADVADATSGDAATMANIVAAASSEVDHSSLPNNYDITGSAGKFTENSLSGALEFTDASNNTIWALTPQQTIPVGQSVTLLYKAMFNPAVASISNAFRVEALVSFGNAGGRGGSGATATNIDVNGSGGINPDEANVRTVPSRITVSVPALTQANDSVTVTDDGLTATGNAAYSNVTGLDQFPATTNSTMSWTVSATVGRADDTSGDSGLVCNTARLAGTAVGGTLNVIIGYTPNPDPTLPPTPIYATYTCAEAASDEDTACVTVLGNDTPPELNSCTYSQGGFGGNGNPFNILNGGFGTVYPSGVEVGIPGASGFSMRFTSAANIQAYLPAGGSANKLTSDLTNPTSTSSGVFGGQVLTLRLNVDLSDNNITTLPTQDNFGNLIYNGSPGDSLNGMSVRQILAAAETALGGGALPAGYTYGSLNDLANNLNLSFHECTRSGWADAHLSRP